MTEFDASIPTALVVAWVIVLGAVIGSFLNVVIARVPAGESIVRPRSRCPRCGSPIAWYDNVPVISWVLLRARCRGCGQPIAVRYPLVELLGAALAFVAWRRHGLGPTALAELAFGAALVALAFIDLDTWLLPNVITWPLIAAGLGVNALGVGPATSLASAAGGAAVGFGTFAVISVVGERVFHREALGFGDVWLLAGLGAWLGLAALLPVVLFASVQGSVVGIALLLLGKGQPGPPAPVEPPERPGTPAESDEAPGAEPPRVEAPFTEDDWVPPKNAVPFGPFLVLGALEWLYLSEVLTRLVPALRVFR